MSVLVKRMDMPTGCLSCDFCNVRTGNPYCIRLMELTPKTTRLAECPLVPVPPHGRLIDADELNDLYTGRIIDDEMFVPATVVKQNIEDMTTIIEAEEEEK